MALYWGEIKSGQSLVLSTTTNDGEQSSFLTFVFLIMELKLYELLIL